jgi:hypothetical protein
VLTERINKRSQLRIFGSRELRVGLAHRCGRLRLKGLWARL